MERETGIEPATNSLEGCDSTIELLPPSAGPARAQPSLFYGKRARRAMGEDESSGRRIGEICLKRSEILLHALVDNRSSLG